MYTQCEHRHANHNKPARDLITLWGDANSPLHEYSCRQWSGLLNDFYKTRWEIFFKMTSDSLQSGKSFDHDAFGKYISHWEWEWVNKRQDYSLEHAGNSIDESIGLYRKYHNQIDAGYN